MRPGKLRKRIALAWSMLTNASRKSWLALACLHSRRMLAASLTTASVPPADTCSAAGSLPYTLTNKTRLSPDSWLLRFALPRRYLGDDPSLPTCLKVLHPEGTDEAGRPKRLEKSYSPVSHPATEGSVDLVVKAYEPRPGGGVGTWLCGLEEGAVMHATLKAKRVMHGDAAVVGRWQHVGLVGGGTGIAPLLQIARILLEDTGSAPAASVRLLSVNRREEDILARQVRRSSSQRLGTIAAPVARRAHTKPRHSPLHPTHSGCTRRGVRAQ